MPQSASDPCLSMQGNWKAHCGILDERREEEQMHAGDVRADWVSLGLGVYGLGHCADGVTWSWSLVFADAVKSGGMLKVLRMQQRCSPVHLQFWKQLIRIPVQFLEFARQQKLVDLAQGILVHFPDFFCAAHSYPTVNLGILNSCLAKTRV
jgi:hypothetical protein